MPGAPAEALDLVEDATARLNLVRSFLHGPTLEVLTELRSNVPKLLQSLESPRPNQADAERVHKRATGVPAVDRLSDENLALARELSVQLRINELEAARHVAHVATQARCQSPNPRFSFCGLADAPPLLACAVVGGSVA